MEIELSDKDRFMLANQYEILACLTKEENYTLMAETLRAGHKWLYDQYFDYFSENLPEDKADHVLTILELYETMKLSYDNLDDKSGVDEKDLAFPGFDGNNEPELLSFARGLVKHDRYMQVLGAKPKNSHMQTTALYARMIKSWEDMGKPEYPLSKEAIQKILAAQIHPDYRK